MSTSSFLVKRNVPKPMQCLTPVGMHQNSSHVNTLPSPSGSQQYADCLGATAVREAKTATSYMCTTIQEMSSTTERICHQPTPHSTVAGLPRDPTEAGGEITGSDAEIWSQIDRGIETGNRTGTESDTIRTGAEREMITAAGIGEEVGKEDVANKQIKKRTENEEREGEATVITKKEKRKQKTNT